MDTTIRFDGRVAVITGAARGLGRAYATMLSSRGASVVVNDLVGAESTASELSSAGGLAVADGNDICSEEGSLQLIETALQAFGRIDIVVNNAGIVRTLPFGQTTRDDFDATFAVHVAGSWGVTHAAWSCFQEQGYGRVIVTTSAAGLYGVGRPAMTAYCAAKGAMYGMVHGLAAEAEGQNLRVNGIAPRAFTPLQAEHMKDVEQARRLVTEQPPELVSPVVAMLAHESCSLNGEILFAGGGAVKRPFMGETKGVRFDGAMTPEDVVRKLPHILDLDGFQIPEPYVAPQGME